MTSPRKTALMWLATTFLWLVAIAASLVAARSYVVPVAVALVTAAATWRCGEWLRHRTTRPGKLVLVVLAAPLLVITIDNVGRAVHMLGGPQLRILF